MPVKDRLPASMTTILTLSCSTCARALMSASLKERLVGYLRSEWLRSRVVVTGRKDSWSFPPPGRLPDPIGGETQCFVPLHSSALKQYGSLRPSKQGPARGLLGEYAGRHASLCATQASHERSHERSLLCQATVWRVMPAMLNIPVEKDIGDYATLLPLTGAPQQQNLDFQAAQCKTSFILMSNASMPCIAPAD